MITEPVPVPSQDTPKPRRSRLSARALRRDAGQAGETGATRVTDAARWAAGRSARYCSTTPPPMLQPTRWTDGSPSASMTSSPAAGSRPAARAWSAARTLTTTRCRARTAPGRRSARGPKARPWSAGWSAPAPRQCQAAVSASGRPFRDDDTRGYGEKDLCRPGRAEVVESCPHRLAGLVFIRTDSCFASSRSPVLTTAGDGARTGSTFDYRLWV